MTWSVPNILTVLRLFAAPFVAILFLFFARPWADWLALALFVGASVTDYVDGILARRWQQVSNFGAMLDPIADKAMVITALFVLTSLFAMSPWVLLPATVIIFREVFVSGLREYLGTSAGKLQVTRLAKWKTFVQMIAIATLFGYGVAQHYFGMQTIGMNPEIVTSILDGTEPDRLGIGWKYTAMVWSYSGGLTLLWVAAGLTLVTGWDYFRKARPYLADGGTP